MAMMMMILLFLLGRECLRDKESTGSRQREHNALAGNVGQKQKYTNTNTQIQIQRQRHRIMRRQCRTKKKTSIGNTIQRTCVNMLILCQNTLTKVYFANILKTQRRLWWEELMPFIAHNQSQHSTCQNFIISHPQLQN